VLSRWKLLFCVCDLSHEFLTWLHFWNPLGIIPSGIKCLKWVFCFCFQHKCQMRFFNWGNYWKHTQFHASHTVQCWQYCTHAHATTYTHRTPRLGQALLALMYFDLWKGNRFYVTEEQCATQSPIATTCFGISPRYYNTVIPAMSSVRVLLSNMETFDICALGRCYTSVKTARVFLSIAR
jgi:hypothetical protein